MCWGFQNSFAGKPLVNFTPSRTHDYGDFFYLQLHLQPGTPFPARSRVIPKRAHLPFFCLWQNKNSKPPGPLYPRPRDCLAQLQYPGSLDNGGMEDRRTSVAEPFATTKGGAGGRVWGQWPGYEGSNLSHKHTEFPNSGNMGVSVAIAMGER